VEVYRLSDDLAKPIANTQGALLPPGQLLTYDVMQVTRAMALGAFVIPTFSAVCVFSVLGINDSSHSLHSHIVSLVTAGVFGPFSSVERLATLPACD
jgi:hypothetical protein